MLFQHTVPGEYGYYYNWNKAYSDGGKKIDEHYPCPSLMKEGGDAVIYDQFRKYNHIVYDYEQTDQRQHDEVIDQILADGPGFRIIEALEYFRENNEWDTSA